MKFRSMLTVIGLVIIWQAIAMLTNNILLVPYPIDVIQLMLSDLQSLSFYTILFTTLIRMFVGLLVSLIFGLLFGIASGVSKKFAEYFMPLNNLIKSIPNMSYIILLLIWVGSERSVPIITFCVLFPIFCSSVATGIQEMDPTLKAVLQVYPTTKRKLFFQIYLPQAIPYVVSSLRVAVGLGLKSAVMAEVLGQVKVGIGKQIHYSKVILDTTAIFSWTIWIILLVFGMDWILSKLEKNK